MYSFVWIYIRYLDNIVDGDELVGDLKRLAYNFAYVNKKYDMPKEWKEDFYNFYENGCKERFIMMMSLC